MQESDDNMENNYERRRNLVLHWIEGATEARHFNYDVQKNV